jgi:very-short-patch-repair endonuclease
VKPIKKENNGYLVDKKFFNECILDGKTRGEITKNYPGRANGAYYLDKFSNHLKDNHNTDLRSYCIEYLKVDWPRCPKNKTLNNSSVSGEGLTIYEFSRGGATKENCEGLKKSSEKMSRDRQGAGNPMFGKKAWNKGKDKRNPSVKRVSEKLKGRKISEETKRKQSESAKRRKIHGHTGRKHTKKTKRRLAEITAQRYEDGGYPRTSSIHIKVREFLQTLKLKEEFTEEKRIKVFCVDFAFPGCKVCIEVQGTFFHIDPRVYPNGPINEIQRRNLGRDERKRRVVGGEEGWEILEIWETEINDGSFKNELICELQKLKIIDL